MTAIAVAVTLIAGPTTAPAPGPGLNDAVRMASTVQWNAVTHWNATIQWNESRRESAPSLARRPSPAANLAAIRECESGGDYTAVSANGTYRGAYQFSRSTWASVGGTGDPATASIAEQDARAQQLYDQAGPTPWPLCGRDNP